MSSNLMIKAEGGVVRLQWFGELTVEAVQEGTAKLAELDFTHAWMDLLAVTKCPLAVRPHLVEFHRILMEQSERRVWIAASPKLRAMGTWIAHMSQDSSIRVVATTPQGEDWLGSVEDRLEPAKRGIETFLEWRRAQ